MGRNWAITIGINQYDNLQPLAFAQRDAESMRDFFQSELQTDKELGETTYHFAPDAPPIPAAGGVSMSSKPTYGTLRRFLRVRFDQPFLKPGDNLWFFFAGHGIRHQERDYLMPSDADPGDVDDTAISLNYVTERLRGSGADNIILLIDACRNLGRSGEGIGTAQNGVVTFFSCSPKERSWEIEALQQGAFTHTLLEGLRLQGAGNCATVERLYRHISLNLPRLNALHGKPKQTPSSFVEPSTKNHLILLPKKATLADLRELKYDASQAEVKGDRTLARQLWIRILAVSPADPDAIEGIERIALRQAAQTRPVSETLPVAEVASRAATTPTPPKPTRPTFDFEGVTVDVRGTVNRRKSATAEYHRVMLPGNIPLDTVKIPGGEFTMGSPETEEGRDIYQLFNKSLTNVEGPQHRVSVPRFWMGKYAVTQAQWRAVARLPRVKAELDPDPAHFKGDDRPVEQVSWDEAVEFCARLSEHAGYIYRLPSEAEWEYACRAGTTTPFHFGPTITTDLANYCGIDRMVKAQPVPGNYGQGAKGIYRQETTAVGSFPPNGFGLYDLHGNVWEWCLDLWHKDYGGFFGKAPTDGSPWTDGGDDDYRIIRGGSWDAVPRLCRSACRYHSIADGRTYDIGFRVCCSAPRAS
ncbi:MAG: SUMF1/EgtB/PvdO family nonheme iron enzyme [Cyanobacteria bacterium]|nr:SUMF1/EgtB/PvdO family nonheme iron enzyme [Cyanobacteriota bacterium]